MPRADTRADPVVEDAIERGYVGSGNAYIIDGITDHNTANDARRSVNRAANRRNLSAACWVVNQAGESCWRDCADGNAPHGVRFRLHPKNEARAHIYQQTGGDPANLKYNPWRRTPKFTDDGRR